MKYYVYILKSKLKNWYYVGISSDINSRFKAHNGKKVKSTKSYAPFDLLLTEEFKDRMSARRREKYYKTGFGKKVKDLKIKP
ncbi:MAG: GIY-YIG nuclease family protein [Candidatus Marinimicrobia bacterium]|nr:GIY-YIG nuclease family protein [Candidatus Neomarinimicrobiota bacterium]MBL7030243.1 GIY-YIG nuclease family protein [Candidatus Neomarinimicrobiota bacterium]